MNTTARHDTFLGAGIAALGLLMNFVVIPAGVSLPPKVPFKALEPAFWPNIIMWIMVLLGAILMIQGIAASRASANGGAAVSAQADPERAGGGVVTTGIALVLLCVFYLLLNTTGFIVASVLALPAFMFLMGERRYWLIATVAVILPFALHFFFRYVASVYVPLGFLERWLG